MTINHIYNIVIDTMKELENINLLDITKRKQNQAQLNRAYKILDDLKDELIRENIKINKEGTKEMTREDLIKLLKEYKENKARLNISLKN